MKHNALVLHKITDNELNNFEDVKTENLKFILKKTLNKTILTNDLNKSFKPSYLITFDDGFKSDYTIVLNLLKEFNAKAIFFIVPEFIGKKDYLTWEQVKEISDSDMEIGSHSLSHPNFKLLSNDERINELKNSKILIESIIGKNINSFSIPFGFTDIELEKLVFKCGYRFCFNSEHGLFTDFKKSIPRNSINSKIDLKKIHSTLNPNLFTKLIWFIEDFIKPIFKKILGNNYNKIRNKILN
jgi:peptidoglycan/xylan/chitin deacetylase (PgdA/CDA1 family)